MKVLVCNDMRFTGGQLDQLRALGMDVVELRSERGPCPEEYRDVEAVVGFLFFNYNDIASFPRLRVIHTTSAGLDHMPLDYIREHGIALYNAGGVYSAPMAEFALGGVLQFYKLAPRFRRQQREHVWKQNSHLLELEGKRVCIVGAGSIGGETARRFSAMGCVVTGLCRHPAPKEFFHQVKGMDCLDSVLEESDIVILALPLSEETTHLFDAGRFAHMKEGAVFVNMARGPICDTQALIDTLQAGRLMGAVIDVCDPEPLPADSPLWDMENVLLTPHNSFVGDRNRERMMNLICKDFAAYLAEQEGN